MCVATRDAGHLKSADAELLASLTQAIVLARRLARDPAKVAEWEKTVRTQAMLSTKLRLTPQSQKPIHVQSDGSSQRRDQTMVKPLEERKADFFAAMKRFNALAPCCRKRKASMPQTPQALPKPRWSLRKCGRCRPSLTQ